MAPELPRTPPVQTSALPATGGRIGESPEDFVVDEVPLYPFSGVGEHCLVRVRKRNRTTQDAIQALARATGVSPPNIGCAGMKDKHALTTQWFSIPSSARDPDRWQLPDAFEVLEVTRHANKLRTGHLAANHFRIRLVDVDQPDAAGPLAAALARTGLVNYFGSQRFGHAGGNLQTALDWVQTPSSSRRRDRFRSKLWPSVLQAEVFNRYTTARLAETTELLTGDVVRLEGSGSVFVVDDAAREAHRLASGDIHLTGPIFGPKMRAASGRPGELERTAIASLGLPDDAHRTLGKTASGTRRDLLVMPTGLEAMSEPGNRLVLSFTLPAGSYATQLVREFTRAAYLDLERHGRPTPPEA